jgi:hypothetical protein
MYIVGDADQKLEVEWPVAARLDSAEAVEHDGFRGTPGSQRFVEQQAVAAESLHVALKRRVMNPALAREIWRSPEQLTMPQNTAFRRCGDFSQ